MTAFFLIDEGSMDPASNTNYQSLQTFGIQLQRNEAVYVGWGGPEPLLSMRIPIRSLFPYPVFRNW